MLDDAQRVEGDHLVGDPAPVERLDAAPGRPRRAPPASTRAPAAINAPAVGDEVAGGAHAAIGRVAGPGEDEERLQDVVVPVRREVQLGDGRRQQPARPPGEDDLVGEEQLGSPLGARRHRWRRRIRAIPLPRQETLDQRLHPVVAGEAEPAGDGDRVPLLRSAAARPTADDRDSGQPPRHRPVSEQRGRGSHRPAVGRADPELDQRDQSPVCPRPLAVGIGGRAGADAAVADQGAHAAALLVDLGWDGLAQQVAPGQPPHRGVAVMEQPGGTRIGARPPRLRRGGGTAGGTARELLTVHQASSGRSGRGRAAAATDMPVNHSVRHPRRCLGPGGGAWPIRLTVGSDPDGQRCRAASGWGGSRDRHRARCAREDCG